MHTIITALGTPPMNIGYQQFEGLVRMVAAFGTYSFAVIFVKMFDTSLNEVGSTSCNRVTTRGMDFENVITVPASPGTVNSSEVLDIVSKIAIAYRSMGTSTQRASIISMQSITVVAICDLVSHILRKEVMASVNDLKFLRTAPAIECHH